VSAEDLYQQQVRESVDDVKEATDGLHPVCDVGGNLDDCLRASDTLVDATRMAVDDLESMDTPSAMSDEEMDLIRSLTRVGDAMDERTAALRTKDDQGWTNAQARLASASEEYQQAVNEILDS
jgi:hypothetical protein